LASPRRFGVMSGLAHVSLEHSSQMRRRSSAKSARKAGIRSVTKEAPVVRFRLRITAGKRIAIGPGKIALLEAIRETGSLTAAAKRLQMSYRRAWLLVDELDRSLETPAVESATGRRTRRREPTHAGRRAAHPDLSPDREQSNALQCARHQATPDNARELNGADGRGCCRSEGGSPCSSQGR